MLCIIQARYSSKRLPGKVLKKIYNTELLKRVYNQVKKSKKIKKIIIATSNSNIDKKIVFFCKKNKFDFFCGPLNNVLKRFNLIIKKESYDSFVRISADSPFIDPKIIDKAINLFNNKKYDIVTNVFPRTFPKGFSVEVIKSKILKKFFFRIKNIDDQEHITKFFYRNYNKFKIYNIFNRSNLAEINLSIDTNNDLIMAKKIIKMCKKNNFDLKDIVKAYKKIIYDK